MGVRTESGALRLEDSRMDWSFGWFAHWENLALERLHARVDSRDTDHDWHIAEFSAEVRARLDFLFAQRAGPEGSVSVRSYGPAGAV